jgi:hypothetical protein
LSTNLYPTPDPRTASEYHPAWCGCGECATDWDLSHRRANPLLIGLAIAIIVAGFIALLTSGAAA